VAHRYARFDPAYRTGRQFEVKKSNKGSCEINQINDPEVPYSCGWASSLIFYTSILSRICNSEVNDFFDLLYIPRLGYFS
jgi:hypothetical protein